MNITTLLTAGALIMSVASTYHNPIRINTNFSRYAYSNGDQLVIDNADGRLTYYTNIYKIGFTSASNIYVLDTWFKWEPGKALGSPYYTDSQLGKCTIHVEPYRYVDNENNKTGGSMRQIAAWPTADTGTAFSFSAVFSDSYSVIFVNESTEDKSYVLGYGSNLIVPQNGGTSFEVQYLRSNAVSHYYNHYELTNTINDVPLSYSSSNMNYDHYVNEWVFEPVYGGSGITTFDFHTIVMFEMSKATINVGENAMCYLYSFKTQNRYPEPVLWWTVPSLGTEYTYSVVGVAGV